MPRFISWINSQSRVQSHDVDTASECSQCTSWLPYLQLCHLTPESTRWGHMAGGLLNQGSGNSQNYLRKPGQIKATHVCWLTFGGFEKPWAALFWFFFILDPSSHILWLILILSYGPGIKPCFIEVQWDLEYVNPLRSKTSPSAMNFEFMEFYWSYELWKLRC